MGLNLKQKQDLVAEVGEQVAKAQTVVIAEYRSLAVADMTELRKRARGAGVYLRVVKNTLARRAVADTPFSGLAEQRGLKILAWFDNGYRNVFNKVRPIVKPEDMDGLKIRVMESPLMDLTRVAER